MSKPTKYWFKRRRYGYGWTPVTYEGWLVLVIFLVVVTVATIAYGTTPDRTGRDEGIFLAGFTFAVLCLICIAIAKGPHPKWRWGKRDHDNHDEDF